MPFSGMNGCGPESDKCEEGVGSKPTPSQSLVLERWMVQAFPTHVPRGLVNSPGHIAEVRGDVVLETFAADVLQQLLQLRNLCYTCAAKGVQRIVSELSWPGIA